MSRPRRTGKLVVGIALAGALTSCAGDGATPSTTTGATTATDGATTTSGSSSTQASGGTTVSMLGAFVDVDQANFEQSMAGFEESTGIDIQYEGSGDFVTLITTSVEAGTPPDIAFFPTPGQVADFATRGDLKPLPQDVADVAADNYIDSWLDLGSVDGQLYGLAYRASAKSLVWYSPTDFAEAGYSVPTTFDELIALSDQIVADGGTPWCMGFESGEATGWPGTDWVEDILLRQQGGEFYDQWVAHEVPFNDPKVSTAFETFGQIALDPSYVFGGSQGILTTFFGDAQTPMFAPDGPQCWLHRQASFYSSFLPDGVTVAPDGDTYAFLFPPIDSSVSTPVMGGGDFAVAFADRPEVMEVMKFLATPASGEVWAGIGGYASPHKDFDVSLYPAGIDQVAGEALASAEVFRFDGSDAMPSAVQPEFWAGVVDYVNGGELAGILDKVEAAFNA